MTAGGSSRRRVLLGAGGLLAAAGLTVFAATGSDDESLEESATTALPSTTIATITTSAAPTTTTSDPETTTTTRAPRTATLSFSGDLVIHSRVRQLAATHAVDDDERTFDFRPMFELVAPTIADADWAICHLEVPLAADNQRLSSYPRFRAPGDLAADLVDVGFDSCSTASNHTLDGGVDGAWETIEVLEAAGLGHSGSARSENERTETVWLDVAGIRIAHLSFTYWFNGFTLPDDAPWAANEIDEAVILGDAAQARNDGADVVIVSMHWGDQYFHTPNAQQADLGPRLLASPDIDLIIGHHAHVVQPIERIGGEWLVYGVGNLLSNQTQRARRDEIMVTATIAEQPDGSFDVTTLEVDPVFVDSTTLRIVPSGPNDRPDDLSPAFEAELDASWQRVLAVLETGSGWDHLILGGL